MAGDESGGKRAGWEKGACISCNRPLRPGSSQQPVVPSLPVLPQLREPSRLPKHGNLNASSSSGSGSAGKGRPGQEGAELPRVPSASKYV